MPLSWKDWLKQTVTAGGTGALTLGSAVSGYQAFAAGDDGKTFPYAIQDGTAWETGRGTYTHAGTSFARTSRTASSTGSALTVTTSAFLFVDIISTNGQNMDAAQQSILPGGRLTLTTAVPVTTSDVTGATTVYYTPYVGNTISLWDGNWWQATIFAEVSLALGTLTNNQCYDVFGFYNAGALNTEMLAWTNNTTRATTVTLQDGRYCKNGDKTRLYLGTFLTTSTTTTEDSFGGTTTQVGGKRFLWNMYNRRSRPIRVIDKTDTWSYATQTIRQANAASGNKVEFMLGLSEDEVSANLISAVALVQNVSFAASVMVGLNTTSAQTAGVLNGQSYQNFGSGAVGPQGQVSLQSLYRGLPAIGYNYLSWNEYGADGTTSLFFGDNGGSTIQSGLSATVMA